MKTITKIIAIFIAFAAISSCASQQPAASDNDFGFGNSTQTTTAQNQPGKKQTSDAKKIKELEEKIAELEKAQKSGGNEKSEKSEKHIHLSLFGGGGGYATGVTTGVNYNVPTGGYNYNTGYVNQPITQTIPMQTVLNGFAIITHETPRRGLHQCTLMDPIGRTDLGETVWKTQCGGTYPSNVSVRAF